MTLQEKQAIAAAARTLIECLESCDDGQFVDLVVDCISSADPVPLEVERL